LFFKERIKIQQIKGKFSIKFHIIKYIVTNKQNEGES